MDCHFARRVAATLPLLGLVATHASAHEKDFAYSVDWALPYRGEHEIEAWSTWVPRSNDFVQLLKYEYGVTDSFAIEPLLEFKKPNGENFELEVAGLEGYVNFRDFGYGKFLPALEAEVERLVKVPDEDDDEEARAEISLRGIVSVYTEDGQDFTVNAAVTRLVNGEKEWEGLLTAGYLRPLDFLPGVTPSQNHPLNVGLEMTQSLSGQHDTGLGPVMTWRALDHLHVILTGLIAVNHRSDHFDEIRLILEWEL